MIPPLFTGCAAALVTPFTQTGSIDEPALLKLIDMQLRMVNEKEINYGWGGGSYPNLLDAHPPFQIDGNFGVCAGIAEMLLQGDADRPQILPALPKAWKNGWVKGLRLPGNKTVDITWQDGKATDVVIR